jgi:deoxyhypusine synthase
MQAAHPVQQAPITAFIKRHFRHFNAAALLGASGGYKSHLAKGGKMFLALGGAMSTAEIGMSLAEMIRQDKVHAVSCTGANLEEDIFNLVAHDLYQGVPNCAGTTQALIIVGPVFLAPILERDHIPVGSKFLN